MKQKEQIYNVCECTIIIFDDFDPYTGIFHQKEIGCNEFTRLALLVDEVFIDLETYDQIEVIKYNEDGLVIGEIRTNTMYINKIEKFKQKLNRKETAAAKKAYKYYLNQKELIENGKIVKFKQKRLY